LKGDDGWEEVVKELGNGSGVVFAADGWKRWRR